MDIEAPLTGNIWKILVSEGQTVEPGDTLIIMESMKMEINVDTLFPGRVTKIMVQEEDAVQAEQVLVVLDDS